jgi:excisionase family DNA binding protein
MYTTNEVADMIGVSKDTILRWLRQKKIPEPARDHNGFRIFGRHDLDIVWRYVKERRTRVMANKIARKGKR